MVKSVMYFKAIGALSISIELTLTGKILKALTVMKSRRHFKLPRIKLDFPKPPRKARHD
jgi:hypothetical protein